MKLYILDKINEFVFLIIYKHELYKLCTYLKKQKLTLLFYYSGLQRRPVMAAKTAIALYM